MAGSYNHIVTEDGNLADWERVTSMLENGGDVFEAVEELYGMIWYLARRNVGDFDREGDEVTKKIQVDRMKDWVELARQNYREGLGIARAVHRISPGKGGE